MVRVLIGAAVAACLFGCKRSAPDAGGPTVGSASARASESVSAPPASLEVLSITTGGAASNEPLPWIVGIHGLGDSPRGISRLFARLSVRAHVHLPEAPHPRGNGYDWFGVRIGGDERALAAAVREAAERLSHSIEVLAKNKRNLGKPVVTGFSQGGILSFALAALHPEQLSASLPIAGWLPPSLMPETRPGAAVPIIAFHGQIDQVVPYAPTEQAVQRLEALGVDARLQGFPGLGHSVNAELFDAWQRALEEHLARARAR